VEIRHSALIAFVLSCCTCAAPVHPRLTPAGVRIFQEPVKIPEGCKDLGPVSGEDGRDKEPIRGGSRDKAIARLQRAALDKGANAVKIPEEGVLICVDGCPIVRVDGRALRCPDAAW
jgi:hypothetical protein